MALILKRIYTSYYWLFEEKSDPRSETLGLFLMSSPIKPVLVLAAYLYFVNKLGPKLMANRKPFDLRKVLIAYNLAQVILNAYIVYEAAFEILLYLKNDCDPIDYSYSPRSIHVLKTYHMFFPYKNGGSFGYGEYQQVFFVLRKKYNQTSFLHVYHHFGMVMMLWFAVKFFGGGAGAYIGLINGAVHTVMYTYYLLTAVDDKWKSSVALKKAITQMQMVQFSMFIVIYGRLLLKSDCHYPKLCSYFFVPQNFFMLMLFGDFYRR
ncbi:hypothetical protein NQ317_013047, partial [Molorchus minor]